MKFGSLLTQYRERAGLNMAMLAARIDVSPGYIRNIEAGRQRSPTIERAKQIASTLSLSDKELDEFLRIAAEERVPEEEKMLISEKRTQYATPSRLIPVFDAPCGKFIDWTDGHYPVGHYPNTEPTDSKDKNAFYIRAHGDSMTGRADDRRTIFDGDLLLVEPAKHINDGDLVFCRNEDSGCIVKRIRKYKTEVHLIPLNDAYKTIILTPKDRFSCFRISKIVRET